MGKKLIISSLTVAFLVSSLEAVDCKALMEKYHTPDPSIKTMKQLKRWCKRKVKDDNKKAVEECLVGRAADNPNKATVAGQ